MREIELTQKALLFFQTKNNAQKRQLLMLLLSNCTYKDGKLDIELKTIFDTIRESGKTGNWCAWQDSNLQPTDSKSGTLSN